jgi:hypothetical protein
MMHINARIAGDDCARAGDRDIVSATLAMFKRRAVERAEPSDSGHLRIGVFHDEACHALIGHPGT